MTQTYVYDNVEVEKTGRTAAKTLKSSKVDVLVEITPTNPTQGTWKKWVRETDLFEVK
jgi:hypothetical protein